MHTQTHALYLLVCGLTLSHKKQEAADTYLKGILGYEERPLVSTDYVNDAHSGIVDAACTQVIDKTMVKIYAW